MAADQQLLMLMLPRTHIFVDIVRFAAAMSPPASVISNVKRKAEPLSTRVQSGFRVGNLTIASCLETKSNTALADPSSTGSVSGQVWSFLGEACRVCDDEEETIDPTDKTEVA